MKGRIDITKWDGDKFLTNWRLKGDYHWHLDYGDDIVQCNGCYSSLKPTLKTIKKFVSILNIPVEVRACHSGNYLIKGKLLFIS